jgi:hypothetical protein
LIGIFMRGYSIPLLGRATTIPKVLLKLPVWWEGTREKCKFFAFFVTKCIVDGTIWRDVFKRKVRALNKESTEVFFGLVGF